MNIQYEDAKILREALAHCANYGTPQIKQRALRALRKYSMRVARYCEHPERSQVKGYLACIDCGEFEDKTGKKRSLLDLVSLKL